MNFVNSSRREGGVALDLEVDGSWKEEHLLNEHFGRALSALAESGQEVSAYWKFLDRLEHPRGWAQAIGACRFGPKELLPMIRVLADRLVTIYQKNQSDGWQWFEEQMTYDNGRLSMGLLWAYVLSEQFLYKKIGLESLNFLIELTWNTQNDCFSFPGNKGWFAKDGRRTVFDQQPVEAGNMVESCVLAYKITGDNTYREKAVAAMDWYFGKNIKKAMLYDEKSGGVGDGFGSDTINKNQGAEALVSYMLAWHSLSLLE